MKRVIFDENLPRPLIKEIIGHNLSTVQDEKWAGANNGELLNLMEAAGWEVFVTADKNLRYQQDLSSRAIAIVELPTNRWPIVQKLVGSIQKAIDDASVGSYFQVELE